jgi:hypothetical protein
MPTSCRHEKDVLVAAASGWARPEDAWLAAHAAECPPCLDAMTAASAMRERVAHDLAESRPVASAVAWWRLERRLREERAKAARRALTIAHGVAGAVATGAVLATVEAVSPFLRPSLASAWAAFSIRPDWLVFSHGWTVPLGLMTLAVALLAPAALYLGFGKE